MITKERNSKIVKAYAQGYSQHTIAKVLGLSQPAVFGVIKRSRELSLSPDPSILDYWVYLLG